jgi:hypothetical protein
MVTKRPVVLAFGAVLLLAAACAEDDITSQRIFETPPWTGPETAEYSVVDRGVDGEGRCTLTTLPEVEPGRTRLERRCRKDQFGDDSTVLVESATLAPISSERVTRDTEKRKETIYQIEYSGNVATFTAITNGDDRRSTERDLPEADEESPEPAWYDDDSLLWLARGVPLHAGFKAGYTHVINVGLPRVLGVLASVEGEETVEVPAGMYETWKVRFEREGLLYDIWVDREDPHLVVRARIEDVTYELLSYD